MISYLRFRNLEFLSDRAFLKLIFEPFFALLPHKDGTAGVIYKKVVYTNISLDLSLSPQGHPRRFYCRELTALLRAWQNLRPNNVFLDSGNFCAWIDGLGLKLIIQKIVRNSFSQVLFLQ